MNNVPRKINVFIKRKIRYTFKSYYSKKDKDALKNTNFVIVSDNCWGGSVYQWLDRPYNSPFIGIGIYGDCYIKLLSNFDFYINQKLHFVNKSKYPERELNYPLAKLGDIEIHFRHYKNKEEAKIKWERRTKRMLEETNRDNYYFKICNAWSANEENFKKFHQLPLKNKLSFHIDEKSTIETNAHIKILERNKNKKNDIPNGVKLFKLTFMYVDLMLWLKEKKLKLVA